MYELLAVILYFSIIFMIGWASYSKRLNASDFIIGSRSLNYWLTALAAHASDMSSWLFMAYPAMILTQGLSKLWIVIGLIVCMYCNWHFIARKIRVATEASNSVTFFSYLSTRFNDRSGCLRVIAVLFCFVFYTVYISVGLKGLGFVIGSLFPISYEWSILLSILVALPYVLIGGYRTLAWIDCFQGLFLMLVIVFVPCYLLGGVGGWTGIQAAAMSQKISLHILPELSWQAALQALLVMLGWGLGYFGQPTIITKFMGIKDAGEISKSKFIGMSWMTISLGAASLIGLIGIPFFKQGLANPEMVFIDLVKHSFHPFVIGLILCAVIAASINVLCSQILVLCSTFTEDIYKRVFRPSASSQEQLHVSRLSILGIACVGFLIAYFKISTIYALVLWAWSGLGASFGPLLIFSLYSKNRHQACAWAGILSGGASSALWPLVNTQIDPIIIGFAVSFLAIGVAHYVTEKKASGKLSMISEAIRE